MRFADLLAMLDRAEPCVWIVVADVQGSAPREAGAGMWVTAADTDGTIGGGHLELKAIELAREWLRLGKTEAMCRHYPLGPALGQCCGGAVDVLFRPVTASERDWIAALARAERDGGTITLRSTLDCASPHTCIREGAGSDAGGIVTHHAFRPWHVWIFGAGHVGKALAQVFGALPCEVTWVDSRDAEFPANLAHNVHVLHSDHPADEPAAIPAGADVLVLTHSHALDLEIVMRLVRRDDLGYVGVIGSETKAAQIRRRLAARGLDADRMTCPMAPPAHGTRNKHPGAIALAVASDLLARRDALAVPAGVAHV